jgi:hypothetical protein
LRAGLDRSRITLGAGFCASMCPHCRMQSYSGTMKLLSGLTMNYNFAMEIQSHSFQERQSIMVRGMDGMGGMTLLNGMGRLVGFLVAWAAMTVALTLASRIVGLGPGFANPLPYAGLAIVMAQTGRLLRKWIAS